MVKARGVVRSAVLAEGLRSAFGGLQVVVLSLALGPAEFGVYSAVFAAGAILQPIVYAGAVYWIQPYLLDPSRVRAAVSHLLMWSALGSLTVLPGVAGLLALQGSSRFWTAYLLLIGEIAVSLLLQQLCLVYLALRRSTAYVFWTSALGVVRLLAACAPLVLVTDFSSLVVVGGMQIVLGVPLCICVLWSLRWRPGVWLLAFRENRRRLVAFGAVGFFQVILDNVDKLVLLYQLPLSVLGVVGMASRINGYALIPARGYALAVYPRYFDAAKADPAQVPGLARVSSLRGAGVTVLMSVVVVSAAVLMERTLLPDYVGLSWIAALLVVRLWIRPFVYAYGDSLYALGRARSRLIALLLTAVAYALAVVLLVPVGGVPALAAVGLVVEALNALLLWSSVRKFRRRAPAQG